MSPTIPHPSEPRNDPHGDWPDDLRVGAELLAGAVDPEQLAAFFLVGEAQRTLDIAILNYADALGHASRALGLDLGETLDVVGWQDHLAQLYAAGAALTALASTGSDR